MGPSLATQHILDFLTLFFCSALIANRRKTLFTVSPGTEPERSIHVMKLVELAGHLFDLGVHRVEQVGDFFEGHLLATLAPNQYRLFAPSNLH
jgi:hypothetical protein